jgi:methionine-rich copper-binding protein CopC/putative copper export protein
MQQRRYLKIFLLTLLGVGLFLIGSWLPLTGDAPTVSAHAFVVGSDPIDSSTISKPPSLVRIYFDAPISAASQATVSVFTLDATRLVVSTNHGTINASNPKELDIALLPPDKLPEGGYEVNWVALSLTDGHTTSGLIGFNLGASSIGASGTPTLGPSTSNHFPQLNMQAVLSVAWEWLVTLALLLWAGILITETLIIPRAIPGSLLSHARKHSGSLQVLCLAGLLVGEIINLVLRTTTFTQTLGDGGINLDIVTQFALNTNYGHFWLARVVLLVAALLFFWLHGEYRKQAEAAPTKTSQRFRQLRQQARAESPSEVSGTPSASISPLTRSQARVSGAIAANTSPVRATTTSQPRIAVPDANTETPIYQPSPWLSGGWLTLAGLLMLSLVLSNEIIQLAPLPISAGLFSWLSLAAQAIWFGCLAYLGFMLLPLLPSANPDQRAEALIRILKYARPYLLAAIGIQLVSELVLGESTIQTVDQLLSTPYGRALLVRDLSLLLMLILTGYMLFFLLPRLQRQSVLLPVVASEMPARRTRTFKLERTERAIRQALHTLSGLAAIALICVALMNFFAPPVVFPNINYAVLVDQPTTTGPVSQTQTVGGLRVTLTVSPAHVGVINTITVNLNDAQGRAVSNAVLKIAINMQIMDMGTTSTTIQSGSPTYTTTLNADQAFTMAGPWIVRLEVDQPAQPAVHLTFQVIATS